MAKYTINNHQIEVTEIGPSVFSGVIFGSKRTFTDKKAVKFTWAMGTYPRAWVKPLLTGIPRNIGDYPAIQKIIRSACRKFAVDTAPAWAKDPNWGFPDELVPEELRKEAA